MNNYTKIQKILSYVLIFAIFFNFTVNISFFSFLNILFASDTKRYDIVAIVVQEEIYDDIKNRVWQYAKNIQWVLPNTKTLIIPTPKNTHPFNIASTLEKLYFEWYKDLWLSWVDWQDSQLIWSVFIWDISLPVVHKSWHSEKTILPYIDFEEKLYVYNHTSKKYEYNINRSWKEPSAEIWHWFISPNTWTQAEDISKINNYFEKNNNFYNDEWVFNTLYEPYVFYYDQLREQKAVKYVDYQAYTNRIQNIEDITYSRFTKELASNFENNYLSNAQDYIWDIQDILPWMDLDFDNITNNHLPDIQTKKIIENSAKRFIEIFNADTSLGVFRKDVYNAGRYTNMPEVSVDMIPYLIELLDEMSFNMLKDVNTDIENHIDDLVINWLSRNIAIPTTIEVSEDSYNGTCPETHTNILYWKEASSIQTANECTIYRWSNPWKIVEANRWRNVKLSKYDIDLLRSESSRSCLIKTSWRFWWNSPLNIDLDKAEDWIIDIKNNNLKTSIIPLFDIVWALEIDNVSKTPSPLNCFDNNFITTYEESMGDGPDDMICEPSFRIPIWWQRRLNWSCSSNNSNYFYIFSDRFEDFYKANKPQSWWNIWTFLNPRCQDWITHIDWNNTYKIIIDEYNLIQSDEWEDSCLKTKTITYNFKNIPSHIFHKSPTLEEISLQSSSMISSDMPIDKDRYIDFILAKWNYTKINYPNLFRVWSSDLTLEKISDEIETNLDIKSAQINSIISSNDPSSLSWEDEELYEILKVWDYPTDDIDLYDYLKNRSTITTTIWWDSIEIDYFDLLVLSVYWNNLTSVPAKYAFILENYLSDRFISNNALDIVLPKEKRQYEISYLTAPWNTREMYIKMDPEDKWENPYADIIWDNSHLNWMLFNLDKTWDWQAEFKCAPPDWVYLWEWFWAIMCRLSDIKIWIYPWWCSWSQLVDILDKYWDDFSDTDNIEDFLFVLNDDDNLNLELNTLSNKYQYGKTWDLEVSLIDNDGDILNLPLNTPVRLEVFKITVPNNPELPFNDTNKKTIYDLSWDVETLLWDEARKKVRKYIDFSDREVLLSNWQINTLFTTKYSDAIVEFRATFNLEKEDGSIIKLEETKTINIDSSWMHTKTYKLTNYESEFKLENGSNHIIASDRNNVFLVSDSSFKTLKNNLWYLNSSSQAPEKIFIPILQKDKHNNESLLNTPLEIDIYKNWEQIIETKTIESLDILQSIWNFSKTWIYEIHIKDTTWEVIKNTIKINNSDISNIEVNMWTNILETGWVITTNFLSILDSHWNYSSTKPFRLINDELTWGLPYTIKATINWNGLTFDDGQKTKTFQTIDGNIPFRLKSTNQTWSNNSITFKVEWEDISKTINDIRVVEKLEFDISIDNINNIEVWHNEYEYSLVLNQSIETTNFNSRAYLRDNSMYYIWGESYINIESWNGVWTFKTKTKSWEKVLLELLVEWARNPITKEIEIKPWSPMKIDYVLSKPKLQANWTDKTDLSVILKDQYSNRVYNDNSTQVSLEIHEIWSNIISSNLYNITLNKWAWKFEITSTSIPGKAYFKLETTPDLSTNSIELDWQSPFPKWTLPNFLRENWVLTDLWKEFFYEYDKDNYKSRFNDINNLKETQTFKDLSQQRKIIIENLFNQNNTITINWVWKTAWYIETYYFLDDIEAYNSLYTTLIGASYWDITKRDYLAWNLLFDKDNRSLAITTLLNDNKNTNDVLKISPDGSIVKWWFFNDLTQDIDVLMEKTSAWLSLDLYNRVFWDNFAKIDLNFVDKSFNTKPCNTSIDKCLETPKTISLKSLHSSYRVDWNELTNLVLKPSSSSSKLIEIDSDTGEIIELNPFLTYEISNTKLNGFVIDLFHSGVKVWQLWISFWDNAPIIPIFWEDYTLNNSLPDWWIILNLLSTQYSIDNNYLWSSTNEKVGYSILYNDFFGDDTNIANNVFLKDFDFWYEHFQKNWSLGWEWFNKTLLWVSSWKSVWEASKDYMTFSMINIWDPVFKLKDKTKKLPGTDQDRKFNSSIWHLLSDDPKNINTSIFDYNNDDIDDIVILKRDWYLELLEWTKYIKRFINRWNIAHISDLWSQTTLEVGDFTWNWYDDILLLNDNREVVLLHNNKKKFSKIKPDLDLNWTISQIIAFKMDVSDSRDDWWYDIVTLDDSWELRIHFWTDEMWIFESKIIDDWLWVTLDSDPRSDLWIVYFDWLYQLPNPEIKRQNHFQTSEELLQAVEDNIENLSTEDEETWFNEQVFDSLVFEQFFYNTRQSQLEYSSEIIIWEDWFPILDEEENKEISPTTFIKSQYGETQWLKVSKTFINTTSSGGILKSKDKIKLEIILENQTSDTLENIAYIWEIPSPFVISWELDLVIDLGWQTYTWSKVRLKSSPNNNYDFLFDDYIWEDGEAQSISLSVWDSLTFSFMLDTLNFKFWDIKAWYFDDTSDNWDIIFQLTNQNCWEDYDLYRSFLPTNLRRYQKIQEEKICDSNLPEELDISDELEMLEDFLAWWASAIDRDILKKYLEDYKETLKPVDTPTVWEHFLDDEETELFDTIDHITEWLGCWFGWWGCINTPLNRAPLAPWNDPTLFWMPIWDWLNIDEWIPIFSGLTWLQMTCWNSPCCIPTVWPMSPLEYKPWPTCWSLWAWWVLWADSPTNFIRIFITPTLTWAMWTAICFWGPASVVWQSNPPWAHPFLTWWNCIISAFPLSWCDDSWWDVDERLIPSFTSDNWFWIYNANCKIDDVEKLNTQNIEEEVVWDYIDYKNDKSLTGLIDSFKEALEKVAEPTDPWDTSSNRPLINIGWNWDSLMELKVDLDFKSLQDWWSFRDVIKIQKSRIGSFPDFIMWWFTAQIEEIVTKLTDFPSLFIVLPDFSWVFDFDFAQNWEESKDIASNRELNKQQKADIIKEQITQIQAEINDNNCNISESLVWDKRKTCMELNVKLINMQTELMQYTVWSFEVWWIRSVYEFLSKMPMVDFNLEKVYFYVPFPDIWTLLKSISKLENSIEQRKQEVDRVIEQWKCDSIDITWEWNWEECANIILDLEALIYSIEENIEILKKWKSLPEDLNDLIRTREKRLEQILCNIEQIVETWLWWIKDNWIRFRAWVDLYITVKAILKSWQLTVDIFVDFEAECKECKNERHDLQYFIWKLISAAIPSIPVIKFPKWPDVILDLHNINMWIEIWWPEFEFKMEPMPLALDLPELHLPNRPSIDITLNLPEIPILPEPPELPELPDLPTLPIIELPNLPPPPKLPKIFASLEWVLSILKLITKVMCILKTSPFVPEWRAWDQIAFITERPWTLPTDFLDIDLSNFLNVSLPFVDAIKVTTYIDFGFRNDMILEMVRQFSRTWNLKTWEIFNSFTNFELVPSDALDFRWVIPENIDIDSNQDWVDIDWFGYDSNKSDKNILDIVKLIALQIWLFQMDLEKWAWDLVDIWEFKSIMNEELKKEFYYKDSVFDNLVKTYREPLEYNFEKENKLIDELIEFNTNKFDEIKNIINNEIHYNKELKSKLEGGWLDAFINSWDNILASSQINNKEQNYNDKMSLYNLKWLESISNLTKPDKELQEIKDLWIWLKDKIAMLSNTNSDFNSNLLATTWAWAPAISNPSSSWSCKISDSHLKYEWIYIEENSKTYRLFDYTDELKWDEKVLEYSNWHIIYMVWNEIYLKENLLEDSTLNSWDYYSWSPLVLESDDNKFYNWDVFYEAVNWVRESFKSNDYINILFNRPTNNSLNNFRVEFFEIIDKFSDKFALYDHSYIPEKSKKLTIDAFSDILNSTIDLEPTSNWITTRNNLAYISDFSVEEIISWQVVLTAYELKNIKNEVSEINHITINPGTRLYAWNQVVWLSYYLLWDDEDDIKPTTIQANKNIEFNIPIRITNITWWDLYIKTMNLRDFERQEIIYMKNKPLFPWTKIIWNWDNGWVEIKYYDGSENILDFSKSRYYELYDLGNNANEYNIRTNMPNDYYYARIKTFKNDIYWTYSNQVLLSPQLEADKRASEFMSFNNIRIPVYTEKTIDVTSYIFEDWWLENIERIWIDWIDDDLYDIEVNKEQHKIFFIHWEFEEIFKKQVRVFVEDMAWNIWYKDIEFEVYSPIPEITDYRESILRWKINEDLLDIPVDIFRIRWWEKLNTTDINTTDGWNFQLFIEQDENISWLQMRDNSTWEWTTLFNIDEYTWKIKDIRPGLKIEVYSSNHANEFAYPKMVVKDWDEEIYYQYIVPPDIWEVKIVDSFDDTFSPWVYYKHRDWNNYKYHKNPIWIPINPWDIFIYRNNDITDKIWEIFKNWQINLMDCCRLEYNNNFNYVVFYIKTADITIWEVMIVPEGNYIME